MKFNRIKKYIREVIFNLRYDSWHMTFKEKVRFYLFSVKWLWKNRNWLNTRKKFKTLKKAYYGYLTDKRLKKMKQLCRKKNNKGEYEIESF